MNVTNKKIKRVMTLSIKLQRKHLRNVQDWKGVESKTELNVGLEPNNRKAKIKNAKTMVPPCKCRLKCFEKMNKDL